MIASVDGPTRATSLEFDGRQPPPFLSRRRRPPAPGDASGERLATELSLARLHPTSIINGRQTAFVALVARFVQATEVEEGNARARTHTRTIARERTGRAIEGGGVGGGGEGGDIDSGSKQGAKNKWLPAALEAYARVIGA